MQVVIPSSSWAVANSEHSDRELVSVTVATTSEPGDEASCICTLRRTGTRMSINGSVHGTVTDRAATANYAVSQLLLKSMPANLSREEGLAQMSVALDRADELARDHAGWHPIPLEFDGISYALWQRRLSEGVVAHADLGWATVSMWSRTQLPPGPFSVTDISIPEESAP